MSYVKLFVLLFTLYLFLGATVEDLYYAELKEISVVSEKIDIEDIHLMTAIIHAEGSTSKEDYSAIACVIVNRSKSKNKSIRQIIYQRGQFDGLHTSRFKKAYRFPKQYKAAYDAALGALSGRYELPISVQYFHNPSTSTDKRWVRYIEKYTYKDIGAHRFCHNPKLLKIKKHENKNKKSTFKASYKSGCHQSSFKKSCSTQC